MGRKLSGFDKVAILLMKLGEDAASEVMKGLDSKHLRQIGARISSQSNIPMEDIEAVLKEFSEKARTSLNIEGKDYIQKVLVKALGQEKATQVMHGFSREEEEGLERLSRMDPKSIANIIRDEHPQTVALILTHLDANQSSEVLSHLPEDLRADIIVRMATLEDIPHGVMQEIDAAIQSELDMIGTASGRKVRGVKLVADILNQTDKSSEEAILASISQGQQELAEQIRQLMFVFDDLADLDDRGMQELLKEVNKEELGLALRAVKEAVKEKIFKNMSERAVQLLQEDMEAKGPVKLTDVEKTQLDILKTAKRLEEEGKIVIGGKGGGDVMV
ncbi:MAG: flagellar motor switch protein FliG [Nitrospiria bacterium]